MNEELEFETYLSISPNKFGIYLLDVNNFKNLYKQEIILKGISNSINLNDLKKFLDENIFKIEKLLGRFIENIFLIIENEKIFNLQNGIRKKKYNASNNKQYVENSLTEAKDLFNENYQHENIMHIIIKKYFIDGESYSFLENNLKCDHLNLEIEFKSISNSFIKELDKVLENYQIKIIRFLDGNYIQNFFEENFELSEMAHKIKIGCNENEVTILPKNPRKLGFFEKFFQLFS